METIELKTHSYSSIDTFVNCPMRYDLTYNKGYRSSNITIALGMGSIAHKCLELTVLTQMGKANYTYADIIKILEEGWQDTDNIEGQTKEGNLLGVNDLKKQFFEDFLEGGYSTKLVIFKQILKSQFIEGDWKPLAVEKEFNFNYNNLCYFHGFIDRVDINSKGELRVVDYKTSKKTYDEKKLNHATQMGVYKNACIDLYGKTPIEYMYHFIFLDKTQQALEGKYAKSIDKDITNILKDLSISNTTDNWKPNPSPLCYWCPFHGYSPNADAEFIGMCQYFSLWTPENKTFKTNRVYVENINDKPVDW